MNRKRGNKAALFVEILLTLVIIGIITGNAFDNVRQEVRQYQSGLQSDYQRLLAAYTSDFKMMVNDIKREINQDVTYEEMEAFLQDKDADYENAIGSDVYDGISLMYKGKYAKSWAYGDYTDYDPNTRPWYQTAQEADGEIAITAPYVTFLSQEELAVDDEYIVLSIVLKYNDDISFCYDVKTFGVNELLSRRYNRYEGTSAMMYDKTGYILSSTVSEYYCHNVYQADAVISEDIVDAIQKSREKPEQIQLVWADGKLQFCYFATDDSENCYSVLIPFWTVIAQAFLGIFFIAALLIGLEIWIYYRTEKQRKAELELERVKNVSQMKQDFLARMSHDMRTPMNGILGLSELSAEETNAAVLRDNMTKIHSSGEYLLGLINDSLDLQKIESGNLVLNPTIVSTKELIETSADMIRLSAEKKKLQFIITNQNANIDGYIKIDAMRMRQIFVNLLSNSIKFTPEGGKVELSIAVLGRDGNMVHDRITVSDTGTGMSADFMEHNIFKPFSQEHNALTDSNVGTGLGLSIVKSLVDLMGAKISVESKLGQGTTFTIDIDFECVDAPEEQNELRTAEAMTEKQDVHVLSGKHILLAEDHPLNAEIATRVLKKVGCTVDWAKNGTECCALFAQSAIHAYDSILMDIRMPELDGLEAARTIRAMQRADAQSVPILAMSANAYEEDVEKSLAAGMNEHLSKPIDPTALYAALCRYCTTK